MDDCSDVNSSIASVPLFPLPDVVLLPGAVIPLHIFEERYKAMTADALRGDRRIAMALLKPGWKCNYFARPAIEPVVCVGTILSHEKLPTGEYNFLLRGDFRARVLEEKTHKPYRIARVERLVESSAMEIDLESQRQRLCELLREECFDRLAGASAIRKMLDASLPTARAADLVAFYLLDGSLLKQSLLAQCDASQRVGQVIASLQRMRPLVTRARAGYPHVSLN
jgi:Lon protease-like protein